MYINDLRKEFYEQLLGKRVLVLVAQDIDALCTCKVLQYLFQCDHIQYSVVPVRTKNDLTSAYSQQTDQIHHVILINCGATYDVLELFEPPNEEVVFFIVDNHRPVDVINIYSEKQVKLLMKPDSSENVPSFDQLFRVDESEEDSDEEESDRRKRFDVEYLEKKRERRIWTEERQKLIFDYTQFTYYSTSSACILLELAWKMSKDTNDLLWWAIVGLTDQYISQKIEQNSYLMSLGTLQGFVTRHNHKSNDENDVTVDTMKISFEKVYPYETAKFFLRLNLYRHWSIYDSLTNTMYTACKFKLWTLKGKKRLSEFLADLGLPLQQCKQRFASVDMNLKSRFQGWIEEKAERYSLSDIIYGSFVAKYGFRHMFSAADISYAVKSILESYGADMTETDRFHVALDCLSRSHISIVYKGLELAKKQQIAIFQLVQALLDMNHVISAGPFLYAAIPEGTPDSKLFCHPESLEMVARFVLTAHVSTTKNKKSKSLPLVMTTPQNDRSESLLLVVGIPPLSEDSQKNLFGKAFLQAGTKSKCTFIQDFFDSSVVEIRKDDKGKFLDTLSLLLT
ncbi:Cell division control protein 45 [Nymphon striatum]|nr:Cell division control protein 45 [Nymphon striatum]